MLGLSGLGNSVLLFLITMDIFVPIVICVIFIILFTVCGWCCKRIREGTVYGYGPNVTITSQPIQSSPVVVPPYPVEPRHPTPQTGGPHMGPPAPGFAAHTAPYPTHTPYPPSGATPYPPATGSTPYPPAGGAPYPPARGADDYNAHPPPYDVAVSIPPVQPLPVKEGYGKQAPYNPHYS